MTDFSIIQNNGKPFTPEDAIRLHTAGRDWLAAMLAEPFDGQTVVVTHTKSTAPEWSAILEATRRRR